MKYEKFLNLAKKQAILSVLKDKHGAVIVKKNKIISFGTNLNKTHPKQKEYNEFQEKNFDFMHHYMHAEFNALNKIPNNIDLTDAIIYVFKIKKNNLPSNSRPCNACIKAMFERGITKMVYTTNQGFEIEKLTQEYVNSLTKKAKKIYKKT